MPEEKLDVGEADEESVEVDVNPDAKKIKSETEPSKETEVIEVQEEKKDELEDYSAGVKTRIDKLTKRMREEERQKQSAVEFAENVKKENESLKSRLQNLDKGYQEEFGGRIDSQLSTTKRALKDAHEAGDSDKLIEAQEALATLTVEKSKLQKPVAQQQQPVAQQQQPVAQQQQPQQPPDPRAEAWAQKNDWFGHDEVMTYASFGIHRRLIEDEGFDPQTEEYYAELDKRLVSEFPHKLGTQVVNGGGRKVASAETSRSRNKGGRKTVRLSPSQVAIAKKLGVPLEEYAKYVKD
tara:strand:- start:2300 stop:3184 length:885 start_codon:yes stop_codon:yes gene_type:complete